MRRTPHHLAIAIAAITALVALSGCSLFGDQEKPTKSLRNYVTDQVGEGDRASEMLVFVNRIETGIEGFNLKTARFGRELQELNGRFDTTRTQLEELLAQQDLTRATARDELIAATLSLRALATKAEWEEMAELQFLAYRNQLKQSTTDKSEE